MVLPLWIGTFFIGLILGNNINPMTGVEEFISGMIACICYGLFFGMMIILDNEK